MRVATFNINNINKRLDNLLAWLAKAEPDVVSLQELKAEQEAFPVNALRRGRYSINKGNCEAVPLIGQFWTVVTNANCP